VIDQSTIQSELTRLVAVHLGKGMSAGSIGLELLTFGIVMLSTEEHFGRVSTQLESSGRPLDTGYSAIG
jgi:hypothetical protein